MSNSFTNEIQKGLSLVSKSFWELDKDIAEAVTGTKSIAKGFGELSTQLKSTASFSDKLTGSFGALGKSGLGVVQVVSGIGEAAFKVGSLVTIADAASTAWKKFSGVSKSLDFAESIQGSRKLADNFDLLERTGTNTLSKISGALEVVFDNSSFSKWSGRAVSSFAEVEQAAYRLSTITVSGNERSIDALDKNIKSMRSLQKETKNALGSVELLNAQYDIASAGFTDSKSNKQVGKSSINLAQAGFGDVGGSTNAIVRSLRALGEDASTAERRAAQLFETTKVGLLTLDQLTPEIGGLASQGRQLGVSFEDITASLAVLTTQGITANAAAERLSAFLGEVVSVSPEAAAALAQFTDEAGKPIQLNAQVLREKGLQGVIQDIKKATNGELAKIKQIFGQETSQEFTTLIIGAGDENLSSAKSRISNVDTGAFNEEAENRGKTLTGAFDQAFNKSQAVVEDFGASLKTDVLGQLENSTGVLNKFSSASASAFGGVLGTLNGIQSKVSAVVGFAGTVFSVVAPTAFFAVLGKGFVKIKDKFGGIAEEILSLKKPGESFTDFLKRQAQEVGDRLRDGLIDAFAKARVEAKQFYSEVKTLSTLSIEERQQRRVEKKAARQAEKLSTDDPDRLTPKAAAGKALKAGGSVATSFFKETAKTIGFLGVGGVAAAGGLAIASGWVDTLAKNIDKKAIPELQEMKDSLSSLEGVSGLKASLAELDEFNAKLETGNIYLDVYAESLTRIGGYWNSVTGAASQNATIQEELAKRQELIRASVKEATQNGSRGVLDNTPEQKKVQAKLDAGVELSGEDQKVLTSAYDQEIAKNKADIDIQKQRITSEKEKGGGKPEVLEGLQAELKALERKAELENKSLESQKEQALFANQLKLFRSRGGSPVPIALKVDDQSRQAVEAQIKGIAENLQGAVSGANGDPAKASAKLASFNSSLKAGIASIETSVDLNPSAALDLRKQLESELAKVDPQGLANALESDPALRAAFNGLNKKITDGVVQQSQTKETARTSTYDGAQSLGLDNAALSGAKFKAQTESIDAQVKALNEELNASSTPLARQLEITAQIEQLESKRAQNSAENRIKQELSSKKQMLTLEEQLLSVRTGMVSLFSQQNEFDMMSISLAKAKVSEAEKQLQISQKQIEISSREDIIRKEEGVKSLQQKSKRSQADIERLSSTGSGTGIPSTQATAPKPPATETSNASVIDATKKASIEAANATASKFSQDEQARITSALERSGNKFGSGQQAIRQNLFTADGSFKGDRESVKEVLSKQSQNNQPSLKDRAVEIATLALPFGEVANKAATQLNNTTRQQDNVDSFKARDIFTQKEEERKAALRKAEGDAKQQTKADGDAKITKQQTDARLTKGKGEKIADAKKVADEDKKALKGAKEELNFAKVLSDVKQRFANLDKVIELNIAKVNEEFASREKIVKFSQAIGNATQNIGSTVKGLSFLGSAFNSIGADIQSSGFEASDPLGEISTRKDKALKQLDVTLETMEGIFRDASIALENAKKSGADKATIDALQKTKRDAGDKLSSAQEEGNIDRTRIKEQTALEAANARLQIFTNRVSAVNEKFQAIGETLSKQSDLFKGAIDLNQRRVNNTAENNKSRNSLQSSVIGFFGANNPGAAALQKRLEVQQIKDDTKLQKSQIVTEGKKEVIDLSVQRQQLELEGQSLENALTQTQLLSDLLSVSQGQQATFSKTAEVQDRIGKIPDVIKQSQALNSAKRGLIDEQLATVQQETQDKLKRADADSANRRLQATQGGTGATADLMIESLRDSEKALKSMKRQDFNVGSMEELNPMLKTLDTLKKAGLSEPKQERFNPFDLESAFKPRQRTAAQIVDQGVTQYLTNGQTAREDMRSSVAQIQAAQRQSMSPGNLPTTSASGGSSTVIQPQITLQMNIDNRGGTGAIDNLPAIVRQQVGPLVNNSMSQLSEKVLQLTRGN
ncbi:phage tail tape measure protein [Chroococcidiopsis sp.]|uniref:phage tail tape measure protein n=1 Tax=Chroococcidiopsis sp. TaxID=3088168 RepID=UPI003F38DBAD